MITTLINFSGGVDSTYYLYRWLLGHRDETILVHHCLLFEKRREVEKKAVTDILTWLVNNDMGNFEYAETEFNRKGISGLLYDVEVVYFMSGLLLMNKYADIKNVLIPRCAEDMNSNQSLKRHILGGGTEDNFEEKGARAYHTKQLMRMLSRRDYHFDSVYRHKTKRDMVLELPEEVIKSVWFCRAPVKGQPCKECFNCNRVIPVLEDRFSINA
jgi:7-cyano-7-deazaguanine synthase in queuosine biosynthesis